MSKKTSSSSSPSKKRGQDATSIDDKHSAASAAAAVGETEELVFEDPFGDEFEEEIVEDDDDADIDDDDFDDDDDDEADNGMTIDGTNTNDMDEDDDEDNDEDNKAPKQAWRPGIDTLAEGEELEYEPSAYVMYHSLRTEWPCLSFDIIRDNLGDNRQRFPLSMYVVSGSQADKAEKNKITLLKLTDLHKTQVHNDSDDEDGDDDEDLDEDPTLEHLNMPHHGGVNRIRSMPQQPGIIATMSETGQSHIYDVSASLQSLMTKGPRVQPQTRPSYSFKGHSTEGFAIDWSPVQAGRLATGDCNGAMHVWGMGSTSSIWNVDSTAYYAHQGSVEDIQWSPSEGTVFSSCSSDKTIKIWDTRQKDRSKAQLSFNAHFDDVNVISWNKKVPYLLASGCDDGSFKVWDLRAIRQSSDPIANFTHHKAAITSIEWAPHDESVLCVSCDDNTLTVWDLSVEEDVDATAAADKDTGVASEYPPQLLFIHQGQYNIKELRHHPQIPGVVMSTAEDGFNIFKPAINAV